MKQYEKCSALEGGDVTYSAGAGERPVDRVVMLPMPDNMQRMESGPVMFGNDWPGVFVRGDSAFGYALLIEDLLRAADHDKLDVITAHMAEGAAQFFRSCKST